MVPVRANGWRRGDGESANPPAEPTLVRGPDEKGPDREIDDMHFIQPRTEVLRRALADARSEPLIHDLLYLEAWELAPEPGAGPALRIHQLRRANPELAAAIRAELSSPRRTRN
jgi:hypothetical protein